MVRPSGLRRSCTARLVSSHCNSAAADLRHVVRSTDRVHRPRTRDAIEPWTLASSHRMKGFQMRGKIDTSLTGSLVPGLIAGVIYVIIAFATGASAMASLIGGIVVAVIAVVIGQIFRAVFNRRAASHRT